MKIHKLYFGVQQKKILLPPDDEVVDLYSWTIERFAQAGLAQYEISNFAYPGWESQHNRVYWLRKPYKAFRLGACSFDGISRFQNEKNLLKYINGVQNNASISVFTETLSERQIWLEQVMLGLRQIRGMRVSDAHFALSDGEKKEFDRCIDELVAARLVTHVDDHIAVTPAGLPVVNEIVVKLCVNKR